jgi:hypothetical protein
LRMRGSAVGGFRCHDAGSGCGRVVSHGRRGGSEFVAPARESCGARGFRGRSCEAQRDAGSRAKPDEQRRAGRGDYRRKRCDRDEPIIDRSRVIEHEHRNAGEGVLTGAGRRLTPEWGSAMEARDKELGAAPKSADSAGDEERPHSTPKQSMDPLPVHESVNPGPVVRIWNGFVRAVSRYIGSAGPRTSARDTDPGQP